MTDEAPEGTDTGDNPPPDAKDTATETTEVKVEPKDWRAALPEDIRENPNLTKFTDIGALAKSYVSAVGMIGRDKVAIPKSDSDWDAWFKAAGRPDNPKEYAFNVPEGLPEGFYDEASLEWFRGAAHKAGLNAKQAQALHDPFVQMMAEGRKAEAKEMEDGAAAAEAALRKDWGNAYDAKTTAARHVVEEFGGEEFAQFLEQSKLGNDPRMVKVFAKVAEAMKGETALVGKGGETDTPETFDMQISEYRKTHNEALMDKLHPTHKAAVAGLTRLYEKKHSVRAA